MQRIVRALSITLADGEEHKQGETVELTDAEVARFEASGALVPEDFDSFEDFNQAAIDAYRGVRGDVPANARATARARESRQGAIVDVSVEPDSNPFVSALRDDAPNADETIDLAEGDPAKAQQVLEAENAVSGGNPRAGVVKALTKIINRS